MSTGSSKKSEKRIVIKNPDGTYSYLRKENENDSMQNEKERISLKLKDNQENLNNLAISDDELQYLIDHAAQFDFNSLIQQVLDLFRSYRNLFILILITELLLMSALLFSSFKSKETTILMMEEIYHDLSAQEANIFFNFVFVSFILLNSIYYPLGFYAISSKKIKHLKYFSLLSLYTAVTTVFVIYINIMFIFVFVLRLVLYGFAKFVIDLLVSVILIPNRHPEITQTLQRNYGTV